MAYLQKTEDILALTDTSYDDYNRILPLIKSKIAAWDFIGNKRVETFEQVLTEELVDNPARHAFRIAILVAVGEKQRSSPRFNPRKDPRVRKA